MNELKIRDNPVKLDITGHDLRTGKERSKTHRGEKTQVDIHALDGYALRRLDFQGVCYSWEDAKRMADFFNVHAECLRRPGEIPLRSKNSI